jgi:hypothetical protein
MEFTSKTPHSEMMKPDFPLKDIAFQAGRLSGALTGSIVVFDQNVAGADQEY